MSKTIEYTLKMDCAHDSQHVVLCGAELKVGEEVIKANGSSRKSPEDQFDISVGTQLAIGRTLETLGKRLQRRANSTITHKENMRKYKVEQANKVVPERHQARAKIGLKPKTKTLAKISKTRKSALK